LYSLWKEEKLKLNNMPLSEIAVLIEDTYGYKVSFSDNSIKDSRISGTLRTENEEALIKTISVALDIEIIKQDSMLLFHSKTKTAK
jgi:ferric-dicitrate binding protein FerR (iron transport regulator)